MWYGGPARMTVHRLAAAIRRAVVSVMGLRWVVDGGLARLRRQTLRRLAHSRLKPYSRSVATGPSTVSDLLDRLKTALADRYAIERELGAGGMATVYLAEDIKRKMAVKKVLRPELAAILGAERLFRLATWYWAVRCMTIHRRQCFV